MTEEEHLRWAKQLENVRHRGWKFMTVFPGFFSFYHPESPYTVYCTPDWNEPHMVDIQVHRDEEGEVVEGEAVPFPERLASRIFRAVLPYLKKYHPSVKPREALIPNDNLRPHEDAYLRMIEAFHKALAFIADYKNYATQAAIDLENKAFDLAEKCGWNAEEDNEWVSWCLKATKPEILAHGLAYAIQKCTVR